jgi:murein DD-endopeptidase MepM/ murein hydrolase activator NlpD
LLRRGGDNDGVPLRVTVSRLAPGLVLGTVAAAGIASAAPSTAGSPTASAKAAAIHVVLPDGSVVSSPVTTRGSSGEGGVVYPKDGSVVTTGAVRLAAATTEKKTASASGSATVTNLSLFDGEITADSAVAQATATTQPRPGGDFGGTGVSGLQALGRPHSSGRVVLGSWGVLTFGRHTAVRTPAKPGTSAGYDGVSVALEVRLTEAHGGLPAGAEIEVGVAEASVEAALPVIAASQAGPLPGDPPQLLPPTTEPLVGVPQVITPDLTGGPYVFPVYGSSTTSDLYGSARQGLAYQHGADIFGHLGQPLVAVAAGQLYSVGWNHASGNRLWLRDRQGNEFEYAHLSAFSLLARNGAHVRAGQVIGFMGDTGNLQGEPTHLHFEIHPVSMLSLGSDGAVDPASYLKSWRRLSSLSVPPGAGWAPKVPGTIEAPVPAAELIGGSDISIVDGLDPAALRRALRPSALRPSGHG